MTAAFRPLAASGPQDGQGPAAGAAAGAAADTGRAGGPVEHGDEAPPPLNPLPGHYEQGFLDDSERSVDVRGNGDEDGAPTGWNVPSVPVAATSGEAAAADSAGPPRGSPAPTAAAAASPSLTFRRRVPQTPPLRGTPGRR
ncbi:unnamed protein product, partial [Ectocarpus sp. 8 AP-2014]